MLEAGGSLAALQEILGPASIVTTQRYGRLGEAHVLDEARKVGQRVTSGVTRDLHRARNLDAGSHVVEWAAKDAQGRRLAPGLYFFRLTAGAREQRGRVVLLD